MSKEIAPLWLHSYSGRENGLMVVGTVSSLRALAQQLLSATETESPPSGSEPWPREVATPEVVGPFKDLPGFTLSFHLQGSAPLSQVVPLRRRTLPTPLLLAVAVCAIAGVVTIFHWVVAHVP